jgi:ribosomal protein L37AE/L43A
MTTRSRAAMVKSAVPPEPKAMAGARIDDKLWTCSSCPWVAPSFAGKAPLKS